MELIGISQHVLEAVEYIQERKHFSFVFNKHIDFHFIGSCKDQGRAAPGTGLANPSAHFDTRICKVAYWEPILILSWKECVYIYIYICYLPAGRSVW